ncbi:MAG: precorrin-3B C(17)-methyltransferase, partial [Actinomycetota bacterium]
MGNAVTGVLTVSITEAGARLARRLPHEHVHGDLAATVRSRWSDVDGFVLVCATGIAVRIIGPLLSDKASDPAVVCVDEAGRFAVPVLGGHAAAANALAREVAAQLGAEAVVTTATDAADVPALDQLPGFRARGDIAGVARRWLDGDKPTIESTLEWRLPFTGGTGSARVVVTDQIMDTDDGTVVLTPPSLVVGVGASTDAPD